MPQRNQHLNAPAARHPEKLLHPLLIEPSDDTCAQPQLGRLQAEILHSNPQVDHAVILALHQRTRLRLQIHALLHHSHHHRHPRRELVHAQSDRSLRHLLQRRLILHNHKPPRLRIASRRSQPRRLQTFHDILPADRLILILPVALSFLYQLRKFHGITFLVCTLGVGGPRPGSPALPFPAPGIRVRAFPPFIARDQSAGPSSFRYHAKLMFLTEIRPLGAGSFWHGAHLADFQRLALTACSPLAARTFMISLTIRHLRATDYKGANASRDSSRLVHMTFSRTEGQRLLKIFCLP